MKILAADKDPELLELIATRLEPRGYQVVRMTKGEDVLFYLEQEKVDLILLSTEVDRMRGSCLVERIRGFSHLVTTPLIMLTEKEQLADLVVAGDRGFDDFLIKPFDSFILQLRVSLNIRRIKDRIDANALSHLPGNHAIERVVNEKIERGEKFSVLYIDINNFKTFNDRYSFEQGDDVIRHTSKIMLEQARKLMKQSDYFIGHIGGDDFVAVVTPEYEEVFARAFLEEFDRIAVTYYREEDRERGCVRVTNRKGEMETFPLMSCSVAACNNLYRNYKNLAEIATDAAEVKSFLKSQPGSNYLRDRRSEPIREMAQAANMLASLIEKKKNPDELLGKILVKSKVITDVQLTLALKKHFETGKRLGQILIAMKAASSDDIGHALEKKWKFSYVKLHQLSPSKEALDLFNEEFMQTRRFLALEVFADGLKVAVCDPTDKKMLEEIEVYSGFKPVPCIALENDLDTFWKNRPPEWSQKERVG